METPILSICIPTYNRAKFLSECLRSITDQFSNLEDIYKVEIIISNNASNDNTDEIVKDYQSRFDNIKYFKNEENIGFDRNILSVVEKSTGKYCLTLGDDDGILAGGLSTILKKIGDHDVGYLLLTNWEYDKDLLKPITPTPNNGQKEDVVYLKLSDYVKELSYGPNLVGTFGGMSTHLFRRNNWSNLIDKEKFIKSDAIHLFILLSAFKDSPFVKINKPCIKTRNDNMRWEAFPELQTASKRTDATIKTFLWISKLYNLNLSPSKIKFKLYLNQYIIIFKSIIKKILKILGLRK